MGMLIMSAQVTVDGVMDRLEGWFDPEGESAEHGLEQLRAVDALILGRANGFRAAPVVRALEARKRRLVPEANQMLWWSALSGAHAAPAIRGFGKLLNTAKEKEAGHA